MRELDYSLQLLDIIPHLAIMYQLPHLFNRSLPRRRLWPFGRPMGAPFNPDSTVGPATKPFASSPCLLSRDPPISRGRSSDIKRMLDAVFPGSSLKSPIEQVIRGCGRHRVQFRGFRLSRFGGCGFRVDLRAFSADVLGRESSWLAVHQYMGTAPSHTTQPIPVDDNRASSRHSWVAHPATALTAETRVVQPAYASGII